MTKLFSLQSNRQGGTGEERKNHCEKQHYSEAWRKTHCCSRAFLSRSYLQVLQWHQGDIAPTTAFWNLWPTFCILQKFKRKPRSLQLPFYTRLAQHFWRLSHMKLFLHSWAPDSSVFCWPEQKAKYISVPQWKISFRNSICDHKHLRQKYCMLPEKC